MRSSAVLLCLAGCDLAFGVHGDPEPCALTSFDGATYDELVVAEDYSVDWDQTFAIISRESFVYQLPFDGIETPIDLGIYVNAGFALAPEGNALFYTAMIEPPVLQGALRTGEATWEPARVLPRGSFAGTPSADVFGPRRVLVTIGATVQEYEDAAGRWITVGEPHEIAATRAPNLTPDGLTAAFSTDDGIYAMTRASIDTWFGEPVKLLGAPDRTPQLLGNCKKLYAIHDNILRRYQR